jgi:hypothetical protein
MGHRRDAVEALRAYARDLDSTIDDGAVARVGSAHQDDAGVADASFGAPHHGLIVGAVGVVLVGFVGLWAMAGSPPAGDLATLEVSPSTDAVVAIATPRSGPVGNAAFGIRAVARLSALGLQSAADAVEYAIDTGSDEDEDVVAAITRVLDLTDAYGADEDPTRDPEILAAVHALIAVTRPPGLDLARRPPGQNDDFVPPGQDDTFVPPGQDDTFVPPGLDDTSVPPGRARGTSGAEPGSPETP